MRILLFSMMFAASISASGQEHYLLAGTYTGSGSKGIYLYRFNSSTGEARELSNSQVANPSYMAIDARNHRVFAVSENGSGSGGVNAYRLDPGSDSLSFVNSQPSHGDAPCYIAVDSSGKWVVVGNYNGGNFSVYPVNNTGALGDAVQIIQHNGSSINKQRQEKPHVHATVFSPDGKYLAVTDLGTDKIMLYPFNASSDKPVAEKAIEVKATPGNGPRHIIFHPSLPFAYVIEELSGTVTAYRYKNGNLTHLQTLSSHPKGYKGDIGSAAIKISPDGKSLYASNRGGSHTIAVFDINQSSGKLKLKEVSKSGGEVPRDFTLDPTGNFLLSTNSRSNAVTLFRRDQQTGLLAKTDKQISIPEPVFLAFFNAPL